MNNVMFRPGQVRRCCRRVPGLQKAEKPDKARKNPAKPGVELWSTVGDPQLSERVRKVITMN